jgi:hypothetical protein
MKSVKWVCDLCNQEREPCARLTVFGPPSEGSETLGPGPLKRRSTDQPLTVLLGLDICLSCLPEALKEVLYRVKGKDKQWVKIEILKRTL